MKKTLTKQFLKWTILCTLCLFFGMFFLSCDQMSKQPGESVQKSANTLEKVKKTGILNVGYIPYPPTVQKDPNTGKMTGHYIDTIEYIAKEMGVKVEYHEAEWGTFIAGLKSGQFDLSIAATYRTIPRAEEVAFTRPLMYVGNSVIVKKEETRFKVIKDLDREDITIAVTQGEQGHEYARINLTKAKLKVLSSADQSLAFTEVSTGRTDAALGDSWACKQFAEHHSEVKDLLANTPYNLTPVGWAVRYDDLVWLEFLNTSLDALESIGKLQEFEKRYDAHWIHPKLTWETW